MSWRKFLIIPQLMYYGLRAPRRQSEAWDRFWTGIGNTGPDGEVLWDAASPAETDQVVARLRAHMDLSLPFVDLGCGNGRQSRLLGELSPKVLGLDGSARAVARAEQESTGAANVSYRVADITAPDLGAKIHAELGDANVHIRGVLHVLDGAGRRAAVRNLRAITGAKGGVYLAETNIASPLDHLEFQGATATSMPRVPFPAKRIMPIAGTDGFRSSPMGMVPSTAPVIAMSQNEAPLSIDRASCVAAGSTSIRSTCEGSAAV